LTEVCPGINGLVKIIGVCADITVARSAIISQGVAVTELLVWLIDVIV
jgi:hypothetical protein